MTSSEIIKKEKHIQKTHKLNYTPKLFIDKHQLNSYMDKLDDKKLPIFYLAKSKVFIVTHKSDLKTMTDKGNINLNVVN